MNSSLYKVVYSCLSTLPLSDFHRNLIANLGDIPTYRKPNNTRIIQDEINRLSIEKRQTLVISIDATNYVSTAILNDLMILFNFDIDTKDRAVVLLAGSRTLAISSGPVYKPLWQRMD